MLVAVATSGAVSPGAIRSNISNELMEIIRYRSIGPSTYHHGFDRFIAISLLTIDGS
jgi:hypothetical protein